MLSGAELPVPEQSGGSEVADTAALPPIGSEPELPREPVVTASSWVTYTGPPLENWAGDLRFTPERVAYPNTSEEAAQAVREIAAQGKRLTVRGTGHSFRSVEAENVLFVPSGIVVVQLEQGRITVMGGTPLHRVTDRLNQLGLALPTLGDVDTQTVAGALATGTHGTDAMLGSLAANVAAFKLITGNGTILECSPTENADVFAAALTPGGAFGVIWEVTLKTVPAHRLHAVRRSRDADAVFQDLKDVNALPRRYQLWFWPHSNKVSEEVWEETEEPRDGRLARAWQYLWHQQFLANGVLALLAWVATTFPTAAPFIGRTLAGLDRGRERIDDSVAIMTNPRSMRLFDMEYMVPAENALAALRELSALNPGAHEPVILPLHIRLVAADSAPLSPYYHPDPEGRRFVAISALQHASGEHARYFGQVEAVLRRHGGRPHWGKIHSLSAEQLRELYPRWAEYQALRRRFDPKGVFTDRYYERTLGSVRTVSKE
jgi:FAD/FMN-containing dehydrogenase